MKIIIDHEQYPDLSWAEPEDLLRYTVLCTMLVGEDGEILDSLSDSAFFTEANDWTTGVFYSVAEIPTRCEHLRDIARGMGLPE